MPRREHTRWYKTALWKARRLRQLAAQPLCSRCVAKGRTVPATVANHVIPHRGDWTLFAEGDLESVCAPCHSGPIQSDEVAGYRQEIGTDGWPIDPAHPVYRAR